LGCKKPIRTIIKMSKAKKKAKGKALGFGGKKANPFAKKGKDDKKDGKKEKWIPPWIKNKK